MITDEMAARFHLPPLEEYDFEPLQYYHAFLSETDYVVAKIAEAMYQGETPEDYTDVLEARRFAREQINELEEGKENA